MLGRFESDIFPNELDATSSAYLVNSTLSTSISPQASDLEKKLRRNKIGHSDSEDNIRILATLVPDEIIYFDRTGDVTRKIYSGVLFFADVSGFTDLCERLTKLERAGASRITQVLNEYIGVMVQEIISHDGDILNFSGDAFLAVWKTNDFSSSMNDVVHASIDCALGIQKSHGQYQTNVGIVLKVKIALAAGQIIVLVIGGNNFMVLGNAMFEVRDIGNICNPGDIIISPSVKIFIEEKQYITKTIPGIPFIQILGIGSEWSPSKVCDLRDVELIDAIDYKTDDDYSNISALSEVFVLRPSINYAVQEDLEEFLRNFVIPPVTRAIDMGEPLQNLTEMRQVVIVFINVLTSVRNLRQLEDLLESSYFIVCDLVDETGGCMNKISMFDKDLIFLVIYGLRGFKHKLQAQQALYCARKIRDKLADIDRIVSASVGVTMGSTYCGVVGHPMRKEYTVIGRAVNKAARLMCAYPDMVTCDRQTFLESQLQSRYFTLQPIRMLKGFTNVGPIYEFDDACSEDAIIEKETFKTHTYPILYRHKELELFFGLLHLKMPDHPEFLSLVHQLSMYTGLHQNDNLNELDEFNMMIIEGAARRGKTRILNEIGYYVKSQMPHYKCTLEKDSRKYKVFRCIFCKGCRITNIKKISTRTKFVWKTISPFKVPEFLCALNDILYVNFEPTVQYRRLTSVQRMFVKRKLVKYLSKRIFKTISLITIDNMENMSDESWFLFKEVSDCKNTFICATISTNAYLPVESKYITEALNTITIRLQPVPERYHGALICQFLNVSGVSLELEKYIQGHSFGNPGWIESFLCTLRHSTCLKKLDLETRHAFQKGFVLPEIKMLKRVDKNKIKAEFSKKKLKEPSSVISLDATYSNCIGGWDIYHQIIPELLDEYNNSDTITICTLTKGVNLQEIDTEEHVDINMLSIYDSLNVGEQLVLKCSAILGEQFTRHQLEYVLQSNYSVKNAKAIQVLFEMKVFRCVRAFYNNGEIIVKHYVTDPNEDTEISCECEGFPEKSIFTDLPKYASCNFISFRKPTFRQMCMNLLTETQAYTYHIRAIWYLENETRRCYPCGRGYFSRVNGQVNDDGMQKYSMDVLTARKNDATLDLKQSSSHIQNRIAPNYNIQKELINVKYSREAINVRTFEENNLIDCRCDNILINFYFEIIEHNQGIGRFEALMTSMLEYAELCIRTYNDCVAFTLIERANKLLEEKLKYIYRSPSWQVPLTKGRVLTLLGRVHLIRKNFAEAEKNLLLALETYNLTFPNSPFALKAAIAYHKFRQKVLIIYFPEKYICLDNVAERNLAENTADTLCALNTLYLALEKYDKAYLAGIWGLTEALRSNTNFYLNCHAFRNAIRLEMHFPSHNIVTRIEDMALAMCFRKYTRLEIYEFVAVIKMYTAIFLRIGVMENILNAMRLGGTIITINSPKYGGYYSWRIYPFFIRCMIFTYNIKELVNIIHELFEYHTLPSFRGDVQNPMNIYELAMQFMVNTTYSIIPLAECKSCFSIKIESTPSKILSQVEMSYYTMIWLWHIRKEEWQFSVNIFTQISEKEYWPPINNQDMCYSLAELVEGLLLTFVDKLNRNFFYASEAAHVYIKYIMDFLKKTSLKIRIVLSRYYFLKAHYNMIFKRKKKAARCLRKAEKYALQFCNFFELDWIAHNKWAWKHWPKSAINDKWIKSAQTEKILKNWENFDRNKMPMFTLRLPNRSALPPNYSKNLKHRRSSDEN